MERIVFKHVYNYFHCNNLFYKYQAGFLPGHATVETYHNILLYVFLFFFAICQRHLAEFGTRVFFSNYKPTGLMEISYSGLKITYTIDNRKLCIRICYQTVIKQFKNQCWSASGFRTPTTIVFYLC